jgi:hypothetical protein
MSTFDELPAPLILELTKEVYDFAPDEIMAVRPKKNERPVNLGLRLIAFAPRSMVEKGLGDWILPVELLQQVDIWRFGVHAILRQNLTVGRLNAMLYRSVCFFKAHGNSENTTSLTA